MFVAVHFGQVLVIVSLLVDPIDLSGQLRRLILVIHEYGDAVAEHPLLVLRAERIPVFNAFRIIVPNAL